MILKFSAVAPSPTPLTALVRRNVDGKWLVPGTTPSWSTTRPAAGNITFTAEAPAGTAPWDDGLTAAVETGEASPSGGGYTAWILRAETGTLLDTKMLYPAPTAGTVTIPSVPAQTVPITITS